MKHSLDLVFLHPGGRNLDGLQGPFIPIGMIGLSSFLKVKGYKVGIYNLVLEKVLDENFSEACFLEQVDCSIFCIDLHWFVHSFETIELARFVKEKRPDSHIIIGGLTASLFAEEILTEFPFVDFVVKGEAEYPLERLAKELTDESFQFSDVPNLTYHQADRIVSTEHSYVINQEDFDNLEFLDFEAVHHAEKMFHLYNMDYQYKRESQNRITDYYQPNKMKFWPVYTGRGCNFSCSFCGGSKPAYRRSFNRQKLILRDPKKVARDILRCCEMGIESIYIPHSPFITSADYHDQILTELERHGSRLDAGFMFEDFPFFFDTSINERYTRIFNAEKSLYLVCIGSLNEQVARFNNCYIPLERIIEIQRFGVRTGARVQLCFMLGMPGERMATIFEEALYIEKFKINKCNTQLYTFEMHPGSEIFSNPDKFNASLHLRSFKDYYNFLKNKTSKDMLHGYDIHSDLPVDDQYSIIEAVLKKK